MSVPASYNIQLSAARRRRARILAEQEEMAECTFRPQISRAAERAEARCRESTNELEMRRKRVRQMQLQNEMRDCTFQPHITTVSQEFASALSFDQRQQSYMQERQRIALQATAKPQDCTFAPDIHTSSRRCPAAAPRATSAAAEAERIYRRKQLEASLASERPSPHPQINPRSRVLARNAPSVHALPLTRPPPPPEPAPTFQPQISRPAQAKQSLYGPRVDGRVIVEHMQAQRSTKVSQIVQEQQNALAREMEECTFQPAVNTSLPADDVPVPVPGLGRHLELVEMARRQKYEDRRHFETVCYVPDAERVTTALRPSEIAAARARRNGLLETEEFNLATANRSQRRQTPPPKSTRAPTPPCRPRTVAQESADLVAALLNDLDDGF